MNREILFRGKREDGLGDWVYGYIIIEPDGTNWIDHYPDGLRRTTKVIPESVGQFTGLLDKNGNRIWEGDIIDSWAGVPDDNEMYIRTVVFNDDYGILELKPGTGYTLCKTNTETLFKVIGTIHDNPELIK